MSKARPFTAPKVAFPSNFPKPLSEREIVDKCRALDIDLLAGKISGDEFFRGLADIKGRKGDIVMAVVSSLMLYLVHVRPFHSGFVRQFVEVFGGVMQNEDEVVQRSGLPMIATLATTSFLPKVFKAITEVFAGWSDSAKEMFLSFAFCFKAPTVTEYLMFLPFAERETRSGNEGLASTAVDFIAFMSYVTGRERVEPRIRNSIDFSKDQLRRSIEMRSSVRGSKRAVEVPSLMKASLRNTGDVRRSIEEELGPVMTVDEGQFIRMSTNSVSQSLRESIKAANIKDSLEGFELEQLVRSSVASKASEAEPIDFRLLKDSVISDETRMLMQSPNLQTDVSLNFPRISSEKKKSPRSSLTEDNWDPRRSNRSPRLIESKQENEGVVPIPVRESIKVRESRKSLKEENSPRRSVTRSMRDSKKSSTPEFLGSTQERRSVKEDASPQLFGEINVEDYLREIADNIKIDTAILDDDDPINDTKNQSKRLEDTVDDDDSSDSKLFGGDPVFQLPKSVEVLDEEIEDDVEEDKPVSVTVKPKKAATARQKREDTMSITAPPKKANLTPRAEAKSGTSNYVAMLKDNENWDKQQQAVDFFRRTLDTNPISLAPQAKEIWASLRDLVVSPRTMLANASLSLAGSLFKIFSQDLSPHAASMIPTLFDIACSSHQFIADGADHILKLISQKAPRSKVWRPYLSGTKHKSTVARGKAAQCMKSLVTQSKLNDKELEAAIQHLAPLLRDKHSDTREAAKNALLCISGDPRFENTALTAVKNSQDYKELMALVEQ